VALEERSVNAPTLTKLLDMGADMPPFPVKSQAPASHDCILHRDEIVLLKFKHLRR